MRPWMPGMLALLACACQEPAPSAAGPPRSPAARSMPVAGELKLAVSSMLSPIATYDAYQGLFTDLAAELERPYRFVQRRTYQEMNQLLVNGEVDLAFICSGAFVALPVSATEIVALPVVDGAATYRSVILARRQSGIDRLADLVGKRFAFTDPLSHTGFYYPAFRVAEIGERVDTFFGSTLFSGSHDRSLKALRRGMVDGAAVMDFGAVRSGAKLTDDLRLIETSGLFPAPPVVASTRIPAEDRERMQAFLVGLTSSDAGRARLAELGIERFVAPGPEIDWRSVREMAEVATAQRL